MVGPKVDQQLIKLSQEIQVNMVLFFGIATQFWPLTVCLSRLVYRVCLMLMHASTLNLQVRIQMTYEAAI